jgi:hypothetical protein
MTETQPNGRRPDQRLYVCDGCMARVTNLEIADYADGEHVLCVQCVARERRERGARP